MHIENKQKNKKNSGFTLVETLVAISIFTVSVLSMLVVLSGGITNTSYAKKKIVASYLAQEGIEYIRNMRDTYVLYDATSQQGWDTFNNKLVSSLCDQSDGCYFDAQNLDYLDPDKPMALQLDLFDCSSICPELLYDDTTGKYGYISGENSGYIRTIRIISQPSSDETQISSTVTWTQGSGDYNVVFSENLFNWVE